MLYTIPDYYSSFNCIAGECPDTCCAGWQIAADEASMKKYNRIRGKAGRRLRRRIDRRRGIFKQTEGKRCAGHAASIQGMWKNLKESGRLPSLFHVRQWLICLWSGWSR